MGNFLNNAMAWLSWHWSSLILLLIGAALVFDALYRLSV